MNGKLDVEVRDGRVIAVWFGCQALPFQQIDVDAERANELGGAVNPSAVIGSRIDVVYERDAA